MITQSELKSIVHYNPNTGLFHRYMKKESRPTGNVNSHGYINISISNKLYYAHRLAWLYTYGVFPKDQIDHKDRKKTNNSIFNLREATSITNGKNRTKQKSKLGITGVEKLGNKYRAYITHDKKRIKIGTFIKKNDAIMARKKAEIKYGFLNLSQ